ncbi:hypothetical protein C7M84_003638 [Penaeus vannamei]|uniref:Uncharacterized protein n=1 Tax=Penaeus vannamei TaxID=6689 RepID=A0A423TMM9_PENVA|nr:hypothetical protein C7M84_003638 [Penaeus vannamei]
MAKLPGRRRRGPRELGHSLGATRRTCARATPRRGQDAGRSAGWGGVWVPLGNTWRLCRPPPRRPSRGNKHLASVGEVSERPPREDSRPARTPKGRRRVLEGASLPVSLQRRAVGGCNLSALACPSPAPPRRDSNTRPRHTSSTPPFLHVPWPPVRQQQPSRLLSPLPPSRPPIPTSTPPPSSTSSPPGPGALEEEARRRRTSFVLRRPRERRPGVSEAEAGVRGRGTGEGESLATPPLKFPVTHGGGAVLAESFRALAPLLPRRATPAHPRGHTHAPPGGAELPRKPTTRREGQRTQRCRRERAPTRRKGPHTRTRPENTEPSQSGESPSGPYERESSESFFERVPSSGRDVQPSHVTLRSPVAATTTTAAASSPGDVTLPFARFTSICFGRKSRTRSRPTLPSQLTALSRPVFLTVY